MKIKFPEGTNFYLLKVGYPNKSTSYKILSINGQYRFIEDSNVLKLFIRNTKVRRQCDLSRHRNEVNPKTVIYYFERLFRDDADNVIELGYFASLEEVIAMIDMDPLLQF